MTQPSTGKLDGHSGGLQQSDEALGPNGPLGNVSWGEAWRTWARVAALSFGGPAGQIAVMHRILVDERRWIREDRFLHALNYCTLLPGPEAQQLATYVGWMMHGVWGGLLAGVLFILPGFLAILALSVLYASFYETGWLQALFFGLKPAVLAIVLEAVLRIGRRVLKNSTMLVTAVVSFVAIFFLGVPFPLVILVAGAVGYFAGQRWPERFQVLKGHGGKSTVAEGRERLPARPPPQPTMRRALLVSAVCLPLWFGPVIACAALLGGDSTFTRQGTFFSKAAVVTFGGAYSVLAYVQQQAVEHYGWLKPHEMTDGLGMAETTPGPLIMVVQFVAYLGAYRNPGPFDPLWAGVLGSVITTWVTFVPCFYWIFLGAPYVEKLRGNRALGAALSTITAAVVGVVLNLAVWFTLHTLFGEVTRHNLYSANWAGVQWLDAHLFAPQWSTLKPAALGIGVTACVLTFVLHRGMAVTLGVSAALGCLAWVMGLANVA